MPPIRVAARAAAARRPAWWLLGRRVAAAGAAADQAGSMLGRRDLARDGIHTRQAGGCVLARDGIRNLTEPSVEVPSRPAARQPAPAPGAPGQKALTHMSND